MDFIDQIQALASRVSKQVQYLATEEATKNALVMPFINALGYNVFDPLEVTPEFTADVGIKKGEKVDYAIMKDGQPIMLFECKGVTCDLSTAHASQLFRYFSVTPARIGVLTNGIEYRFFSDLEEPNKMDGKPFLEFNIMNVPEPLVPEIKKLTKAQFDAAAIIETAGELKYTKEMKKFLVEQLVAPHEEMVRLLTAQVYSGRLTKNVRDQFEDIVRRAFRHFVNDQVSERLKSALEHGAEIDREELAATTETSGSGTPVQVETTQEEMEAFHIVRAILSEVVEPERVAARDVKTYFGVLLDDNNRKPICRLHFNTGQKYVGLFDNERKEEERVPIQRLTDLYRLASRIRATPGRYEAQAPEA